MHRIAALAMTIALAGCAPSGEPEPPRLSGAQPQTAAAPEGTDPQAAGAGRGFFGRFFAPVRTDAPLGTGGADRQGQAARSDDADPPVDPPADPRATASDSTLDPAPDAATPPRRGLLGFLSRKADAAKAQDAPAGLSEDAPDRTLVQPGTTLPYGVLARVCDLSPRDMGKRVARHPERGGGYALYDSAPGRSAPHSFFVTGFDDGCARQFTAAVAMFGAPQMHEMLRYGLPARVQPYSETDAAYEKIKSRVCGVGRGKPCGRAMSRLARNTVFVSVYERFGSNPRWKTVLLHDGQVVASDIRGP